MSAPAKKTTAAASPDKLGRQVRTSWIKDLSKQIAAVDTVVVAQLGKVPTRDLNKLREQLQAQDGSFNVVKNSLCKVAFKERGWVGLDEMFQGTCGISPVRGDPAVICKMLVQFAKDHEGFVLKGGLISGELLKPQDLSALAKLPSRQVMLAQLVGGIQAPLSGLVGTLNGVIRKAVGVLDAILKQKESKPKE